MNEEMSDKLKNAICIIKFAIDSHKNYSDNEIIYDEINLSKGECKELLEYISKLEKKVEDLRQCIVKKDKEYKESEANNEN